MEAPTMPSLLKRPALGHPPLSRPSIAGLSAVVTGGSRGLGLLLAEQLAVRHCDVTIVARDERELARAEALVRRPPGVRIRTAVCDVRDREAVRRLMRDTALACGGIDIVIANAGIIQVAPVDAIGAEEFEGALDSIFMGALHTSLEALPYLRRSPAGGRLALIGSVGGLLAVPHMLPYSCAKAAVGALAEGLHAEAARDGVSVTAVHPGLMRTGSHLHATFGGDQVGEFAWFSAIAGAPVVSMGARRAADRIVTGVQRRRIRIVLTPTARAASLAHGLAPALTTRMTTLAARGLPDAKPASDAAATGTGTATGTSGSGGARGLREGASVRPPAHLLTRRLRAWGSALNDRMTGTCNQRPA
ncbi:SDR family NAD(P)-dependent oxidoreductase [Streptomyces sp. MnatMP-M17]|uniref:SDR family NAD(P)-dependent oxidoreductase n=2 Tax=unclassified Streptomyces TaxID=2593676 RepID=UPI00352041E2